MTRNIILSIQVLLLLTSCNVFKKTAKQGLTNGVYTQKMNHEKEKVYIHVADENIHIYPTISKENTLLADTTKKHRTYTFLQKKLDNKASLSKTSLDFDLLTIPIKFRFAQQSVPPQMNTNINGALFIGYRTDKYTLDYQTNPLQISERKLTHVGYSVGLFSGIGNTLMSPTNSNNILSQEYDAVVWSKGIAGIFGINNFTLGLTVGFDNLLDKNSGSWIYKSKPWLGLSFGLNLN